MKINVLLVDDHQLILQGLTNLINAQPDMVVVGTAETGAQGVGAARNLRPDVVVLDINLPDFNGLVVATQMTQLSAPSHKLGVVVLSMYDKERTVVNALKAGATSYVTKASPSDEIIQAIRSTHRGRPYLSSNVAGHVVNTMLRGGRETAGGLYDLLTEREQEVFRLLVHGHTNRAIAEFLSISPRTVEKHRANIMAKLEVRTARELILVALEIGVLEQETRS